MHLFFMVLMLEPSQLKQALLETWRTNVFDFLGGETGGPHTGGSLGDIEDRPS